MIAASSRTAALALCIAALAVPLFYLRGIYEFALLPRLLHSHLGLCWELRRVRFARSLGHLGRHLRFGRRLLGSGLSLGRRVRSRRLAVGLGLGFLAFRCSIVRSARAAV